MKYKLAIASLYVVISLCVFYACKKQDQNLTTTDHELFNTAIQKWKTQFLETASAAETKLTNGITARLNYGNSIKIALGDTGVLFIIAIKEIENVETGYFLSIALKKGVYSLDGIYEASVIQDIRSIYTSHSLRPNDSILVRGINYLPIKEWLSDAKGQITYRVAKPLSDAGYSVLNRSVNTERTKINAVEGCEDMWWWEIDENTGEWVPMYFLYQLCDKPDDPSESGPSGFSNLSTTLCQTYNFTTVANSYYASITNLAYSYTYGNTNMNLTVLFPNSCLQIPNYSISAATAGTIFNSIFNITAATVLTELNTGVIQPIVAQARFKTLLQATLISTLPGSTWTTAYCGGSVPNTTINYNSFCP